MDFIHDNVLRVTLNTLHHVGKRIRTHYLSHLDYSNKQVSTIRLYKEFFY